MMDAQACDWALLSVPGMGVHQALDVHVDTVHGVVELRGYCGGRCEGVSASMPPQRVGRVTDARERTRVTRVPPRGVSTLDRS